MAASTSSILIARGQPLDGDALRWLTPLRDRLEFEGSFGEELWWIRADCSVAPDAMRILSLMPKAELFLLDEQQRLIPLGMSVPVGVLPAGVQWKPIRHWIRIWLPQRQTIGKGNCALPLAYPLQWQPSEELGNPGGLLCRFFDWSSFVLKNIQSKWRGLRFACCSNSHGEFDTLVVGSPIPSIRGVRLVDCSRILTPMAFTWVPAVPAQTIRRSLRVAESDWVLWESEASMEIVSDSDFLPTTRVSIRATANAIAHSTGADSFEKHFQ